MDKFAKVFRSLAGCTLAEGTASQRTRMNQAVPVSRKQRGLLGVRWTTRGNRCLRLHQSTTRHRSSTAARWMGVAIIGSLGER